jgi:hypothetical protein
MIRTKSKPPPSQTPSQSLRRNELCERAGDEDEDAGLVHGVHQRAALAFIERRLMLGGLPLQHPEHLQEQQQGENRVKSMLFHMSGERALLTTCSKCRSPPGADVPVEWICRQRAQLNSSHIPPPQGHLGAAVAFGKGAVGGETLPAAAAGARFPAAADDCFSGR